MPAQQVIALSTHETDKIRLVNIPPQETEQLKDAIRQAVARAWPAGVQREQVYGGCPEFKIKGTPFWAGGADTIHVRQLMMQIIEALGARGYQAIASCDISKKEHDSDTIFFVRTGVAQPPVARVAVMLAMTDTIRLIGGSPELQQVFQAAVQSRWSKPPQKIEQYHGSLSIKLKGTPWWSNGVEAVESRACVCHVLAELARVRSQAIEKIYDRTCFLRSVVIPVRVGARADLRSLTEAHRQIHFLPEAAEQRATRRDLAGGSSPVVHLVQ